MATVLIGIITVSTVLAFHNSINKMEDGEKPIQKSISMFDIVIILILSVLFFQLGMYMLDAKGR